MSSGKYTLCKASWQDKESEAILSKIQELL